MKYAFMSFSCPELGLDELLGLAKRFGYDGLEPRIASKHRHGLELDATAATRLEAKDKAAAAGVVLCCIATSCMYANPTVTEKKVQETLEAIDLAADVGAKRIRVFGGAMPEGMSREDAVDRVAGALSSVADHAAERGVTICMETHDSWCAPGDVAEVMRRVDHKAVRVNWDIMHPVRAGGATMDQAYQTLAPWIRHVHFHDGRTVKGKLELCPIGEGDIDHERAVEVLGKAGYDDYLSGEWIGWEPYEKHLPRELATMKAYERQLEQEAP